MLKGAERESVVNHLAECVTCRKTVSLLGTMVGEESGIAIAQKKSAWTKRVMAPRKRDELAGIGIEFLGGASDQLKMLEEFIRKQEDS